MRPIDQTTFSSDWQADDCGNCLQACLASIFDFELSDVPHFVHLYDDWFHPLQDWLAGYGLYAMKVVNPHPEKDGYERLLGVKGCALMFGKSPRGAFDHIVVSDGGKLAHDPHPTHAGLESVNGFYVFVSLNPIQRADTQMEIGGVAI